ncbi:hypothetical protein KGA66_04720 [Actinocrinis puniceicyclus]|uniref:Secreted protein n=1 Tax=Actinocrinis puniceicyclus TaxID=977794 RepID=A0A8J7WHK1_9ACTN|nr:hypothetical protein [Actinocrinis puniceicyclus]MBS2962338.1 hypothetical protein [Actinocrinis puniceicyclus]
MKPIKSHSPIKRRALLLAAVPLTAVLAGGVAVAATGASSPSAPAGTTSTLQDRDRARDGSCLESPTATPSATATTLQDRDRARDGSCLDSPTAVPGTSPQHMYEHQHQHGEGVAGR